MSGKRLPRSEPRSRTSSKWLKIAYAEAGYRIPHGPPVDRGLGLQVVSELREDTGSASHGVFSGYALVAAGEHNGLKNYAVDLIGVAESRSADLPPDDSDLPLTTVTCKVVCIPAAAMFSRARSFARCNFRDRDVCSSPPRRHRTAGTRRATRRHYRLDRKISAFRKTNTIGRNVKTMEAHALRVSDCRQGK